MNGQIMTSPYELANFPMSLHALVEARHGRFLLNTNDRFVGKSLSLYGEWSEAEVTLFSQIVRTGDAVVEAGANIGSHTVFLSKAAGTQGSVIAFEASRYTHLLLCANLALNECLNVHAIHKAVGAVNGSVPFPVMDPTASNNFGEASVRGAATASHTELVDIVALDSFEFERLDFIKSDIEGHELSMLQGSINTIQRLHPVLYLEVDCGNGQPTGNRDELVEFVERLGYSAYYYITPMFNHSNFRGHETDIFGSASVDLICVPDSRAKMDGLTRAKVGDSAIEIAPGRLMYALLPWTGARFSWR